jgi:SAM-dependent methyltransferase
MRRRGIVDRLPRFLRDYLLDFEARIEREVARFAARLPERAFVLDAGAGECRHAPVFAGRRYVAVDLGVGDASWNYRRLDAVADLARLPFRDGAFDAALSVVTLEHVRDPRAALAELARALRLGGRALLIVPQEWEVHQAPHDYFRYTAHGIRLLIEDTGLEADRIEPMGGFFRLLSRRLLNALQFFPGILFPFAALVFVPPALILPLADGLDRERNFTLGYICRLRKSC